MAGTVEAKLKAAGVVVPSPAPPIGNYVSFVRSGSLLYVSGQLCRTPDGKSLIATGKLGGGVSKDVGVQAARACGIYLLGQVKMAVGDLDKVTRVVRLGGFVNSVPGYTDSHIILNGASDLMVEAFDEKGIHARSTIGVASLPMDAAVEVEGLFEVS